MLLLLLACSGCSGSKPIEDSAELCDVELDWTVPEAAATDAYYRSNVEFGLSDPDPTAVLSSDAPGEATESEDGETLYWSISEPLQPNTTYSATLTWCGGEETIEFTTSGFGEPLTDTALVEGATYAIDLATARIVDPPGIGAVLNQQFRQKVLVSPVSASSGSITLLGAVAVEESDPLVQDWCSPTFDFPSADFSEAPYFTLSTDELSLSVAGWTLYMSDASLSGTFAADGSQLGGAVLTGLIDTRSLATEDIADPCALAENFGGGCIACPDGEIECVDLWADQIYADKVADLALVEIAGTNCEGCADAPPEEGATCEE